MRVLEQTGIRRRFSVPKTTTEHTTPFMASEQQVKRYLAYWFQLGKKVLIRNGDAAVLAQSVFTQDRYSDEFERIWQLIVSPESGDCYLEGTHETIAQLLTPRWIIEPCVRCDMPVPMINIGLPPEVCPCNDLATWPNTEIPLPRGPVDTQNRLSEIRDRLNKARSQRELSDDIPSTQNSDSEISRNMLSDQWRLGEILDSTKPSTQGDRINKISAT
jgi:hypothetical protein